ncbi:MAG: TlyA family RNA methyltransferase [Proteobacteria bacterium]|nr:TlyA family RNA methyltransferase [Pseudomonadota bacterium]
MAKTRIDRLLVERGLAPTRQRAQALVMAGCVLVGDVPVEKPGQQVPADAGVRVRGEDHPYVGRGGVKLAAALRGFAIDPAGRVCMDVGASTGGFTDALLQSKAAKVYAIDVGYGQLDQRVARDERVVVLDRQNIRSLKKGRIAEAIDVAVIDVSFISLALVLPAVDLFLAPGAQVVALVKPQFEVGRELVGKGGIVKDPASHGLAVEKVKATGRGLGWEFRAAMESPITGAKGNREFLVYFVKGAEPVDPPGQ